MPPHPHPHSTGRPVWGIVAVSVLVAACCVCARPARAESPDTLRTKVKAAYLFNFIKFVDWPTRAAASGTKPIRICVVGTDPVTALLQQLAGRQVKGRPLAVEHRLPEENGLDHCQVLFISQSEHQRLPQLLQHLPSTGVLTVSDIDQFCSHGGVIGFVLEEDRIKIEINLRTARKTHLKISAKLLEVARVVQ